MRALLIAERPDGEGLASALRTAGLELESIAIPHALADALLALEPRLAGAADTAVVLGDDSDLALAAALVAAKLQLPLAAIAAALDPARRNGRLLGQLADAKLGDDPSEISAWARRASGPAPLAPDGGPLDGRERGVAR